jgi:hypothetical protein
MHPPSTQLLLPAHCWQVTPAFPQKFFWVPGRHTVPPVSQQPAHVPGSHTQVPLWQRCPVTHDAVLVPQTQRPSASQVSASSGSHVVQAPPITPQVASPAGWQPAPSQQPPGQLVALQVPSQRPASHPLAPQSPHAAPWVPHAVVLVPGWHWPVVSQQPLGQVAGPQT